MQSIKTTMSMNNGVYKVNNNVNDNVNISSNEVDLIADKLVDQLSNPIARRFYCKVAYKLPENKIWNNLEQAMKGRNPQRYFTWLCKREMSS